MSTASRQKKRGYTTTPNLDTHLGSQLPRRLVRIAPRDSAQTNSPAHYNTDLPPLVCGFCGLGARDMRGEVVRNIRTQALAGSMESLSGVARAAESVVFVFKPGKELVERGIVGAMYIVG